MAKSTRLAWAELSRSARDQWSAFRRRASLRRSDLKQEAPNSVWFTALIMTVVAYVVSFAIAHARDDAFKPNDTVFWSAFAGALVGTGLFLVIAHLIHQRGVVHLFEPLPRGKEISVVVICAVVVGVLAILFTSMNPWEALKNPGGLFLLVFSVLSMVSFWAGFSSLLEFRRVITSFQQLHGRLLEMAQSTEEPHTLKMLAYTPAIGFLALRKEKWDELKKALEGLRGRLEIVCLDHEDLRSWHGLYKGRQTLRAPHNATGLSHRAAVKAGCDKLTEEDIKEATDEAEEILAWPGVRDKQERKKLEMMPGFYLIFNEEKAIIVTPFFTPYPFGTPGAIQRSPSEVQMFGVETTDRSVIKDVEKIFLAYQKDVPPSPTKFLASQEALQREEVLKRITSHCLDLSNAAKMHFRLSVFEDS